MSASDPAGGSISGAARTIEVLRLIATAPPGQLRAADLAERLGLHKASVSRLLATLIREGALRRDRQRGLHIAEGFRALMGAPMRTTRMRQLARLPLALLTEELGDASFLSVPSGLDALCVERQIGSFPIQALSLQVGARRPLGVGAGGLALLCWAPDDEREALLSRQSTRLAQYRCSLAEVRHELGLARERGYVLLPPGFVVPGMTGAALPVRDPGGLIVAAASVAAINDRLSAPRSEAVLRALRSCVSQIEARIRDAAEPGPTLHGKSAPPAPQRRQARG